MYIAGLDFTKVNNLKWGHWELTAKEEVQQHILLWQLFFEFMSYENLMTEKIQLHHIFSTDTGHLSKLRVHMWFGI